MKKFFFIMSGVFGTLAIILFGASVTDVNGVQIANIQTTVFCAACAVLWGVNLTGGLLVSGQRRLEEEVTLLRKETEEEKKRDEPVRAVTEAVTEAGAQKPGAPVALQKTNAERTAREDDHTDWIAGGENFVKCPRCGDRMTIDYIRARKKCPRCGYAYTAGKG